MKTRSPLPRRALLAGAIALALAGHARAQFDRPPSGPPPLSPEQLLRQFDGDGDGKIGKGEAPGRMQQRWDHIDTDRDGFVTLGELQARDARLSGPDTRAARSTPPAQDRPPQSTPAAREGTRALVNAACSATARDGKSWASAFVDLQEAIASGAAEIWVAKGTYAPGQNRDATFQLRKGGALYGGFAGNETRRDQRDWRKNATVLDGRGAYHVVTGADDATLDGFTVTGGNGLGAPRGGPAPGGGGARPIHTTPQAVMSGASAGSGAGILNFQASPTIRNCIFEKNRAGKGGGAYNMTSTSFPPRPGGDGRAPVFIDCTFRNNFAQGRGGGVSNDLGTSPTFLNCVFDSNETPQKGGGMYNDFGCSPILINCLFTKNNAQSAGGMGNDGGSSPILYHCAFTENHAVDYGAPLYQGTGPASDPILVACSIAENRCDWEDPGIYNWHDCSPRIIDGPDPGYRPGRFAEEHLPRLLTDLARHRTQPAREPSATAPRSIPSSERVIHVDARATGGEGDGRTWTTAYRSLHDGLRDAGKDGAEVRVAAGIYRLGADRSESFVLQPGVKLFGGYRGERRDPANNPSVLDGNRAYHVLVGADGALLDGFTVTGGCADGTGYDGKGGGLINYRRGPQGRPNSPVVAGFAMTIRQCLFADNSARDGGAVYSYDRARPIFNACVFRENRAENGGAVLDRVGVQSRFEGCEFIANAARWRGGALYFDYGSRPNLANCVFRDNATDGHGGAAFAVSRASQLENTVVTMVDCRFEKNAARGYGGAAAFCDSSMGKLAGCIFTGNRAGKEGNDLHADTTSSASRE